MQNRTLTFVLHLALIGYLVIPQWAFQFPAMVRPGFWANISPYLGPMVAGLYAGLAVKTKQSAIYGGMIVSILAAAMASSWLPWLSTGIVGRISFGTFYFLMLFGIFGIGLFFALCIRSLYARLPITPGRISKPAGH